MPEKTSPPSFAPRRHPETSESLEKCWGERDETKGVERVRVKRGLLDFIGDYVCSIILLSPRQCRITKTVLGETKGGDMMVQITWLSLSNAPFSLIIPKRLQNHWRSVGGDNGDDGMRG